MTEVPLYRCTRCDEKKEREEFPGVKKRNSWCRDCVKAQREEKKERESFGKAYVPKAMVAGEEFDLRRVNCHCGLPKMYLTYSEIVCAECGRAYKAPAGHALGRRATEKEISDSLL